jgi:hypothetical protein
VKLETFSCGPQCRCCEFILTVEIQSKCSIFIRSVLGKPDPSTAILYVLLSCILSLSDIQPKAMFCQLMSETVKNSSIRMIKRNIRWGELSCQSANDIVTGSLTGSYVLDQNYCQVLWQLLCLKLHPMTWDHPLHAVHANVHVRFIEPYPFTIIAAAYRSSSVRNNPVILYRNYYTVKLCYTVYDRYNNTWSWDTSAVLHTRGSCRR